jgi:hydrogenase maturation factor
MDLTELKLKRLEEDYKATVEAGERVQNQQSQHIHARNYDIEISHAIEDEYLRVVDSDGNNTARALIEPVPYKQRENRPLEKQEVDRIKSHMQTLKLKHEPSWAKAVSDEQLVSMLQRVLKDS